MPDNNIVVSSQNKRMPLSYNNNNEETTTIRKDIKFSMIGEGIARVQKNNISKNMIHNNNTDTTAVLVTPSSSSAFRRPNPGDFSFDRDSIERKSPSLLGSSDSEDDDDSDMDDVEISLRRLTLWPATSATDELLERGPRVQIDVAEGGEGTEIRLVSSNFKPHRALQQQPPSLSNPVISTPDAPACSLFSPFNDAAAGVAQMISGADEHITPKKVTAAENVNEKDSPFPQACCCKYIFDSPGICSSQTTMETSISSLLGTQGFWFDGWQAWSLYFDEFGNQLPLPGAADQPDQLRTGLQNRAFNMNARAQHIRRLQDDMAPFSAIRSDHTLQHEIYKFKRTLSHCNENRSRTTTPISDNSASESGVSIEKLLETVKTCGEYNVPDISHPDPQDLCYDSDPGEYNYATDANTRRSIKSTENLSIHAPIPQQMSQAKYISEFMNTRMTLVWHPAPDTDCNQSPQCVSAWIELGQQLRKTIIQPKLMWRRSLSNGRVAISNEDLHGIDLLDIARVLEVSKVNRKLYPFARKSCSFSIDTLEYSHVFEASSEAERSHIVQAIKLIVARLGSKIILNDNTVFDEFFSNMFFSVPGKEPHLIPK